MSDVVVRQAVVEDVEAITRIYNHAVINTTATFDMEPKTIENRLEWFAGHNEDRPLIVATVEGRVVGWASLRPFGTRAAYRHTLENAVYVDSECQGMGVGSALLARLVEIARKKDHHAILALIVGGNEGSEKLHIKYGFELVGRMREVGRKFDRWLDVLIYELLLDGSQD